jgi:hypothetical protein
MRQFKLIYLYISTFSKLNFSIGNFSLFDTQVTASEFISFSKFSNVGYDAMLTGK